MVFINKFFTLINYFVKMYLKFNTSKLPIQWKFKWRFLFLKKFKLWQCTDCVATWSTSLFCVTSSNNVKSWKITFVLQHHFYSWNYPNQIINALKYTNIRNLGWITSFLIHIYMCIYVHKYAVSIQVVYKTGYYVV